MGKDGGKEEGAESAEEGMSRQGWDPEPPPAISHSETVSWTEGSSGVQIPVLPLARV